MTQSLQRERRACSAGGDTPVPAVAGAFGEVFAMADLRLAYALSCHRAQGSQARLVVASLADTPMLTRTGSTPPLPGPRRRSSSSGRQGS
ncbi:hypothetical protein D3272_13545 [Lichenibacterium ramalinae]|uniref:UvrD-like helicase C-terminal domain-containing protein n=1 Tax=Lichenibacterium ramalinae TaxID=2316527 RepID=A0A4Q2RCV0_9HYPH|nr:hypothetical protein D3272_13545 [Lichenibacterium ramalinae]